MEKLLTISIAGYNVEKYIENILNSLSQSKYLDKIEILVIDDGGTDSTLEIAKRYETRFPSSIIAIHKENGGWGSTVNTAIEKAKGKYLKLLDGDDYFDITGLDNLVSQLENNEADLVFTPRVEFDDETGKITNKTKFQKEYPIGTIQEIDVLKDELALSMHSCTFKLSNLRENKTSISEKCFYTDFEYLIKGLGCTNTVMYLEDPVYFYRLGREGQSVSLNGLQKHYDDQFIVLNELLNYSRHLICGEAKKSIINMYISLYIDNTLICCTELGRQGDAIKTYKMLREEYNDVYIPRRSRSSFYIKFNFIQAKYFGWKIKRKK